MKTLRWLALLPLVVLILPASGEEKKADGFVPMFNGKDLTGWVNVNCAPGTFYVKDGQIVTTGKPTGFMRTEKQYENFIADFEWMHVPPKPDAVGNSGFFVWADPLPTVGSPFTRGIEVQVLVNLEKEGQYTSHGDVFSIHGATCKPDRAHPMGWARCLPSERRAKGANEWNHYRVEANNGVIKLAVNGKEVSGVSEGKPRKGYLCLESEGSECRFKNLKIKELPSTKPAKEEIAEMAKGFRNIMFSMWKPEGEQATHWAQRDWLLRHDGKGEALHTEEHFGDGEFITDFRFDQKKTDAACIFYFKEGKKGRVELTITPDGVINVTGGDKKASGNHKVLKPTGQWNRLHATLGGHWVKLTINGMPVEIPTHVALSETGTFGLTSKGEMEFANLFVRSTKSEAANGRR